MEPLLFTDEHSQVKAPKRGQELNLIKELFGKLLRNWYWFVLSVFLCLGIGRLYLRYQTPVYNIESRFMIKKNNSPGTQGAVLSQLNGGDNSSDVQNQIEILRTEVLMKRVVHNLQLNVNIYSKGNIKSTELYKTTPFQIRLLYQLDSVGAESWTVGMNPQTHQPVLTDATGTINMHWGDTVRTRNVAFVIERNGDIFPEKNEYQLLIQPEDWPAYGYLGALKVGPAGDEGDIIRMTISDPLPQRGKDILNNLYDVFVRANMEDHNTLADSTIAFINNRLAIVTAELSGVEKDIEVFKSTNNLVDLAQQSQQVTSNINELEKQKTGQDVQLEILDAIGKQLDERDFRIVPTSLQVQSGAYSATVAKFNELVLERDAQLETTKPSNPVILQLNDALDRARVDLRAELKDIRNQMMISETDLEQRIGQSMTAIRGIPSKQRVFLDISRQQEVKQQLYLFLLQKREETAISKSGTQSDSRLIEPARADAAPFSPNPGAMQMSCLIAGLLIPSAALLLLEILNNKIRDRKDILAQTEVPIIGEIGHNHTSESLVLANDSRSLIAEQFRAVRTNLRFLLTGKAHQVILVTSSMSGEGKSFISLNLAASLAISGKKVVLLELDLRKPRLSQHLDLASEQGFTNFIISNADLKHLPQPVADQPNLFIISSGPIPPNPSELLLQEKMKTLFDYLYSNFDYIVIDTPPVGLVTDAMLVAPFADCCLYVARQGYTFKEQITIIDELFRAKKMKGLSIILNDVEKNNALRYGYGHGHSSYYLDEQKRKGIWNKPVLKS